jgi:tRNA threonylcarbamoyladenosine biosynthesis protein TsaE
VIERSESAAATEAVGERLGRGLGPGDVVCVSGELGAGKTTLIRGACAALGVGLAATSPTFTIGRRYEGGRVPVSHLDLYRLGGELSGEDPGLLEDYLRPDSVSFIEWPEAAEPDLERIAWRVAIRHAGGDAREIELSAESGPAG